MDRLTTEDYIQADYRADAIDSGRDRYTPLLSHEGYCRWADNLRKIAAEARLTAAPLSGMDLAVVEHQRDTVGFPPIADPSVVVWVSGLYKHDGLIYLNVTTKRQGALYGCWQEYETEDQAFTAWKQYKTAAARCR